MASTEPLSRAGVVAGGIALADAEGIAALTMRRLAAAIGSEPMSLYRHVRSKADLLDGMVDAVAAEVALPGPEVPWPDAVATIARGAAEALRRHPWAAPRWLGGVVGPGRLALMESLLAALGRSGRPADVVDQGFHAVVNHVVGSGVAWAAATGAGNEEPTAGDLAAHPHLAAHVEHHRSAPDRGPSPFDFTLEAILRSLRGPDVQH